MSYLEDSIDWQLVETVDALLDDNVPEHYKNSSLAQDWARICKVIEELGEVIRALIGVTGQNPRKGVTHSYEDVLDELSDTALTAILAMQHFTKSSSSVRYILTTKLETTYWRMRDAVQNQEGKEGIQNPDPNSHAARNF